MRHANIILLCAALIQCSRQPAEISPWAHAQRGTAHLQADLTSLLDTAAVPPGNAAPLQHSTVRIQGVARAGIYMQAPSRARFRVFVHPEARLSAWVAMIPGCWAGSTDGAEFRVSVISYDLQDSVCLGSIRLDPRTREQDRRWVALEHYLLPWAGSMVFIELAIDSGPTGDTYQDWCIWGEPVVFSPPLPPPDETPREVDRRIGEGTMRLDWCFTSTRMIPASQPGEVSPANLTSAFTLDGVRREGLYAHPPWSLSHTVIPGPRARLVASMGMVESCWEQSDGVLVRVRAEAADRMPAILFEYWLCPRANRCDRRWVDIAVDLSRFVGEPLTLTLETSPGPIGDLSCDSVTLGSPRIVSDS